MIGIYLFYENGSTEAFRMSQKGALFATLTSLHALAIVGTVNSSVIFVKRRVGRRLSKIGSPFYHQVIKTLMIAITEFHELLYRSN